MAPMPTQSPTRGEEASPLVILCECGMASPSQRALTQEAREQVRGRGLAVLRAKDLCRALAERDGRLTSSIVGRRLLVLACQSRAVRWLLQAAGIDVARRRIDVVNLRRPPREARECLMAALDEAEPGEEALVAGDDTWISWYPVIDRSRCQDCGQCASFCVFGVYAARPDGSVVVTHPQGCKTNCPACARLCPSAAIIFPKHDEAPFDGSEISDEEAVRARTLRYRQGILGQDPYAALAARRRRVALLRQRPPSEPAP